MLALALLNKLRKDGIKISRLGEELKLRAPEGKVTPELLEEIRSNKQDLLDLLITLREEDMPIEPASPSEDYPVTFQQHSLWILSQDQQASSAYNIPMLLEMKGEIHLQALQDALKDMIERHEVLRTSFFGTDTGELRQKINQGRLEIRTTDISGMMEDKWKSILLEESMLPLDFEKPPLLRVHLLRKNEEDHLLSLVVHHIIVDGASLDILQTELLQAYDARKNSLEPVFAPLPLTYKDVAVWQHLQRQVHGWEKQFRFWEKELQGEWPGLQLIPGKRPAVKTNVGRHWQVELPRDIRTALERFCVAKRVSFFSGLLSALQTLIYRYTGNNDLVIGTVTTGREKNGLESLVGLLINTLPLRTRISTGENFTSLLLQQEELLRRMHDHQDIPFSYLVECLDKQKDKSRSAIFDIMVIYNDHRHKKQATTSPGSDIHFVAEDQRTTSQFDCSFIFHLHEESLLLEVEYNTDIYDENSICKFTGHYINYIKAALEDTTKPVEDICYLSGGELKQLLGDFNDTCVQFETGLTLTDLFKRQTAVRGDTEALIYKGQTFTYEQLDKASACLAQYLLQKYLLRTGDLVGILQSRSEWMIISILAVLKCGCAYIPIDPDYPQERIDFIKTDSACRLCIDQKELDTFFRNQNAYSNENPAIVTNEYDIAYIIYTSGSTGRPKGCMLEHKGVINRIEWMWRKYDFDNRDVVLQKTTFTFDVSVWEIFLPLCWGGKMVLCEDEEVYSPARITDLIRDYGITCIHFVPGMLDSFMDAVFPAEDGPANLSTLKRVITSGEALSPSTVNNWYAYMRAPLCNLYGPTEASIDVSYFDTVPGMDLVPIGRPIANTRLYILDLHQQPVPIGVVGELYISGIQVARGYLNREDLTAQRFLTNPFEQGERFYRTGDRARWLPDGNIEYLGRFDEQVKIRGFRIELGEIEHTLRQFEGVEQAILTVYQNAQEEKSLVAYLLSHLPLESRDIKRYLKNRLPEYMVPAYIVLLKEYPLTANGKIDKKKFPAPDVSEPYGEFIAARNGLESEIAALWQDILHKETISVKDSFFDVGGDSIKAIRLISLLNKRLKTGISMRELYEYDTVELLAKYFDTSFQQDVPSEIQYQERMDHLALLEEEVRASHPYAANIEAAYPMSDIQKGMVLGSLANPEQAIYHEQFVYQLTLTGFDPDLFARALSLLTVRNETLRTGFDFSNYGEAVQIVFAQVPLNMRFSDITTQTSEIQEKTIREWMKEQLGLPYDFSKAPLWRVCIFKVAPEQIVYILQFHHAILDGWSVATFNTSLSAVYLALQQDITYLPPLLSCTNKGVILHNIFAAHQKEHEEYWKEELTGYKRLDIFSASPVFEKYVSSFEDTFFKKLNTRVKSDRITLKTAIFAAFQIALYMLTYEEELTIGIVGNTRPPTQDADLLLGCFLNTVPVRFKMPAAGALSWKEYAIQTHIKLQEVKKHDVVTLPSIAKITQETSSLENPFFDVMYNFINFHVYEQLGQDMLNDQFNQSGGHLDIESYELANTFLVLDVHTTGGKLEMSYTLSRRLKANVSLASLHEFCNLALMYYIQTPDDRMSKEAILPPSIKDNILNALNNTGVSYTHESTVLSLFAAQVLARPGNVALRCGMDSMTYSELDRRSDDLACILSGLRLGPGNLIPVCMDRSMNTLVAILGILKAGAAFVPLDSDLPSERIGHILTDIRASLVIGDSTTKGLLATFGRIGKLYMDEECKHQRANGSVLWGGIHPDQLAYVIYTSGSTGKPKGVEVTHANLGNYLNWVSYAYLGGDIGNFALYTALSFDLTITSLFGSITNGKTLFIFPAAMDSAHVFSYAFNNLSGIDIIKLTPAHILLLDELSLTCSAIKRVIVGGEQLYRRHVEILKRVYEDIEIVNEYGPTEVTVGCSVAWIKSVQDPIHIGRPIANCSMYIMDRNGQLQLPGVPGELHAGGLQLSRGYLNNRSLTTEKFIKPSFDPEITLYKTGDLAKWLPDGNIEYIGRIDDQVKIRGYRIEPGEVEHALQELEGITGAVVTVYTNHNLQKQLVAYITGKSGRKSADLRLHLASVLPVYMIPAFFVQISSFPLTPNGKIDKSALPPPSPDIFEEGLTYVEPHTKEEIAIAAVYGEVLQRERVGLKDSFFELGGDSIQAIMVINRLRRRGYAVMVADVLRHPIVGDLAGTVKPVTRHISQDAVEGEALLSPIQRWFLNSHYDNKQHYNQSVLLSSNDRLDKDILQEALRQLTIHHDALRMVYRQREDGEWYQYNTPVDDLKVGLYLYELNSNDQDQYRHLCNEAQSSFQIDAGPLLKAFLFRFSEEDRLLLVAHHLIVDGVSWRILLEDLRFAYDRIKEGEIVSLPLKTDSFKSWTTLLNDLVNINKGPVIEELDYWKSVIHVSRQPVARDYQEDKNSIQETATMDFQLDENITSLLLSKVNHVFLTEINDLLLTALGISMSEVMGAPSVLVGMEGHGREDIGDTDVSRTVGWFTSLYPLLLNTYKDGDHIDYLATVKEELRRVPRKGIGYGMLRYLWPEGENQLKIEDPFDVTFNYLGNLDAGITTEDGQQPFRYNAGFKGNEISASYQSESYLSFTGLLLTGKWQLYITYRKDQYRQDTIHRLGENYIFQLSSLVQRLHAEQRTYLTPSDVSGKEISWDEIRSMNKDGNLEDVYELSPLQEGIYYHWLAEPGTNNYIEQLSYSVQGLLDEQVLRSSYEDLVNRHAMLRTSFSHDFAGKNLQLVWKEVEPVFTFIAGDGNPGNEAYIQSYKEEDRKKGFQLNLGSQMRLSVLQTGKLEYEFIWTYHHILIDGWCIAVLMNDFFLIYHSRVNGRKPDLQTIIPYARYITWLSELDKESSASYWRNHLRDYDTLSGVPWKERPAQNIPYALKEEILELDPTVHSSIRNMSRQDGITESSFLHSAWGYLLGRYNNSTDVVYGSVVSGRPGDLEGVENMIGLFINTIPVRIRYNEEMTVKELLKKVQGEAIDRLPHVYNRLSDIQGDHVLRNNLFDHPLAYLNYPVTPLLPDGIEGKQGLDQLRLMKFSVFNQPNYDFNIIAAPDAGTIKISLRYNAHCYTVESIRRLKDHFNNVMTLFASTPEMLLRDIDYLTDSERSLLVSAFNRTSMNYPADKTILDLFAAQVRRDPEHTAIVFEGRKLSYRELDDQSNQLSRYLSKQGARDKMPVATLIDRSVELIVSLLGILKCGSPYVPLDPSHPGDRISHMLADIGPCIVISHSYYGELLEEEKSRDIIFLDRDWTQIEKEPKTSLFLSPGRKDLAYIIYTSGSTGRPKGVMIEHTSIVNLIHWHIDRYGVTGFSRSTVMAGVGFDACALEIWSALLSGSTLFIVKDEIRLQPELLLDFYRRHGITHAFVPPALIATLILADQPPDLALRYVLIGGDRLPEADITNISYRLVNQYGPTEATVMVTDYPIDRVDGKMPPIGKPIHNTSLYVLDQQRRIQPIGVPGELYIGGVQLARGYWNNSSQTNEKFIEHTFLQKERLYRTGDMVRWLPDGNLEYIGRIDDQVKIRGYRIELGEVEHALQQLDGISGAAVIPLTAGGDDKMLVAYVVSKEEISAPFLRKALASFIPAYMVPAAFVRIDSFPLTTNGKIDRKSLPEPEWEEIMDAAAYVAPRNETEAILTSVFQEILHRESVSITDNFFDLGGDSIKAILLINRVKQRGYSVKVGDVLKYPVVEELAPYVQPLSSQVAQTAVEGNVLFTPVQRWFLDSSYRHKHHYNQSVMLAGAGALREDILLECFRLLIGHHDALRIVLRPDGQGGSEQVILPVNGESCHFEVYDFRETEDFQPILNRICDDVQASIDLLKGPLMKTCLFRLQNEDRLLLVVHHLVIDGVSWRILLEDLSTLYQQLENNSRPSLPLKTDSFLRWAERLHQYADNGLKKEEIKYWESVSCSNVLALPPDMPEGENRLSQSNTVVIECSSELTSLIFTKAHRAYNTDTNDILLTAVARSVNQVFGATSFFVALEGHGRQDLFDDIDIGRTLGWFTTVYPVLLTVAEKESATDLLIRVKENLRGVPNKGIGYGLLRFLNKKEGCPLIKPPVTDIAFNYLGDFGSGVQGKDGSEVFRYIEDYRGHEINDDYEQDGKLIITGLKLSGKLRMEISYSNALFYPDTIKKLAASFKEQLNLLVISLSEEERSFVTPSDLTCKGLNGKMLKEINKDGHIEDIYSLSPLQQGIYFHWLAEPGTGNYVEQTSYKVKGQLNMEILLQSYRQLTRRHPILRTYFTHRFGEGCLQIVSRHAMADFIVHNIAGRPEEEKILANYKQEDRLAGFDLETGSQMRLSVIDFGNDVFEFIWSYHHILMDGWCIGILVNEFYQLYHSLLNNKPHDLPKPVAYANYIRWLSGLDQAEAADYWKQYLLGYENSASVPFKEKSVQHREPVLEAVYLDLDNKQTKLLKSVCTSYGVTESSFLQAAWGYLLGRYNDTQDVVFGTIVSGRPGELEGVESMIGLFINTIPTRIQYDEHATVRDLVQQVQQASIKLLPYHYMQLSDVQMQSPLRNDLFDHLFIYENYPIQVRSIGKGGQEGLEQLQLLDADVVEQTNYDFHVTVVPGTDEIQIILRYNGLLFLKDSILTIKEHLAQVIRSFLSNAETKLIEIDYMSSAEKEKILNEFNETKVDYPFGITIVDMFVEQAERTPHIPAVIFEAQQISYLELHEKSNTLAGILLDKGIGEGDFVPLLMSRGIDYVVGFMAVLKAGAAVVPLSIDWPGERIRLLVKEMNPVVALTNTEGWLRSQPGQEELYISIDYNAINGSKEKFSGKAKMTSPIYMFYTSGTTGLPKGVVVSHKGIANRFLWMNDHFGRESAASVLRTTRHIFDSSVWQLFWPLINGGKTVIPSEHIPFDLSYFVSLVRRHQITMTDFVPALFNQFVQEIMTGNESYDLSSLINIVVGGEAITVGSANYFINKYPAIQLTNLYGPTEASIGCVYFKLERGDYKKIPIGKPIANTRIYILDKNGRPVPQGITGEIYIAGQCISDGYFKDPSKTLEKFRLNPFSEGQEQYRTYYRTGDLGRWLQDGNIEYIGRSDDQLKIRGYRVEPAEIENILRQYQDIIDVVVTTKQRNREDKELIAYFTSLIPLSADKLQNYAATLLPEYMIPRIYIQIEEFPLAASGKVDKRLLASRVEDNLTQNCYVPPRNEIENRLSEIWQQVLGTTEKVGITDNFFELGGHSIKAIAVLSAIYREFDVTLGIKELFQDPTIDDLAKKILNIKWLHSNIPDRETGQEYEIMEL